MGAGNSQSKQINPNKENTSQPQSKQMGQQQKQQMTKFVKETFHNVSINGNLTKDKFNQALAILEGIGFKRLRDTPIADRLFFIFDKNNSGYISETDVVTGLTEIVKDRSNAVAYTFKAYDSDKDNRVSKRQFTQFIEQTWMTAFRILSESLSQKQLNGVKHRDIEMWAKAKVSTLNEQTNKMFNQLDRQSRGYIQFPGFKQFVLNTPYNDITAHFDTNVVIVPLHLVGLYKSAN